jgi:AcrR family transcriptional regulator
MTTQARALQTRRAIVRAAADAFVKHGFSGASLSGIAQDAGVTKGALYFHFPSKTALASAMILTQNEANAALEEYARTYQGAYLDLLVNMTRGLATRLLEDPTLRAAMRLAVERGETEDAGLAGTYETWERLVGNVAQTAKDHGELAEHVDRSHIRRSATPACSTGTAPCGDEQS